MSDVEEILWKLQRLSEPNGLITSDVEWATQQLLELVNKAQIDELERLYRKGDKLRGVKQTGEISMVVIHGQRVKDRILELKTKPQREHKPQ